MKKKITSAELEVMRGVWDVIENGETATTRTVRKSVNELRTKNKQDKLYGQIIYTHIENLQKKGYVKVMRTENGDRYYIPLISKENYIKHQMREWAHYWNKSLTGYTIMALGEKLSQEEKADLWRYLDELD